MKKFIFVTEEGFTVSPNNSTIDNLQVLGIVSDENKEKAWDIFLKDNSFFFDSEGFSIDNVICYEIKEVSK